MFRELLTGLAVVFMASSVIISNIFRSMRSDKLQLQVKNIGSSISTTAGLDVPAPAIHTNSCLHNGIGNIVSFIDYIASRRHGICFPNPIPNYLMKQSQTASSTIRPTDVMKDEMFRTVLRKRLGNL